MKTDKSILMWLGFLICLIFAIDGNAQSQRKTPAPGNSGKSTAPPKTTVSVPSNAVLQSLVKATIGDFANSVRAEDFTVLWNNSSEDFKATFTIEQLREIFYTFIEKKSLVLPGLLDANRTTAAFSTAPYIRTEKGYKILVLNGAFPTKPYKVLFENEYELENGKWKLLAVKVKM